MKIEHVKALDIERVGEVEEGIEAGISSESLPFLFEMLSKGFYSDPIGSIVREITSNCFDAHIEAGVDEPVVIHQSYDAEEGYAIEFQDKGVGLSPERLVNIYMNYFSSTKRDTDDQIGGFGLGSKSPLSYADLFYISTVYNGMQYDCILHKGETKPQLESFYGWDKVVVDVTTFDENLGQEIVKQVERKFPAGMPTEQRNGTTIKINVATQDLMKFKEAMRFQLTYFDNVYFSKWGMSNDYDIYEGEYFKFRSDIPQSNQTEIHLCIGNVRYPIDFKRINVLESERYIPIAVKFQIGELKVVPNREAIRYTPEGIELIQTRIKQAVNELHELYQKQNPIIDSLEEYSQLMNETPKITLDKEKGHYIYSWNKSGLGKAYRFGPLVNLPIKKTPKNIFFMYEVIGTIGYDGKYEPNKWAGLRDMDSPLNRVDAALIASKDFVVAPKGERLSIYTELHIREKFKGRQVAVIRRREVKYEDALTLIGLKESKTIGKAKTFYEFIKVIEKEVLKHGKLYSFYKPTDQWIADYKRKLKEASPAFQRKINNKVFVRDAAEDFSGKDIPAYELQNRTGLLIYGFKEDRDDLKRVWKTLMCYPTFDKLYKNHEKRKRLHKALMVIQISKASEKAILGAKKTIYWKDFLQKTLFFKKIATAHQMFESLRDIKVDGFDLRRVLVKGADEDWTKVMAVISRYYNYNSRTGGFMIEPEYLPKELDQKMYIPLNEYRAKHTYKIPLLTALKSDVLSYADTRESLLDYLKDKKIRLENKWYLKIK